MGPYRKFIHISCHRATEPVHAVRYPVPIANEYSLVSYVAVDSRSGDWACRWRRTCACMAHVPGNISKSSSDLTKDSQTFQCGYLCCIDEQLGQRACCYQLACRLDIRPRTSIAHKHSGIACCHVAPAPPAERRSAISESNLQRSGGRIEHCSANDRRAMHLCTQHATTPGRRTFLGDSRRRSSKSHSISTHIINKE